MFKKTIQQSYICRKNIISNWKKKSIKGNTVELWCFLFRSSRTLGVTPRPPYRETSVCTPCINSPYHWTGSVCTMCPPPRPPVRTRYWHDNAQFYKYVYPYKYSSILLILTNKKSKTKKKRSFIQSGITNVDRSAGPT